MSGTIAKADALDIARADFEDAFTRYKRNPNSPPQGALVPPPLKKMKPAERRKHIREWAEEKLEAYVAEVREDPLHADRDTLILSRDSIVNKFDAMGYSVSAGCVTRDCRSMVAEGILRKAGYHQNHYMLNPPEDLQEALVRLQQTAKERREKFESKVVNLWRALGHQSSVPKGVTENEEWAYKRRRRRLRHGLDYDEDVTYREMYRVLKLAFPEDVPDLEIPE